MTASTSVGGLPMRVYNPAGQVVGQIAQDRDGRVWLNKSVRRDKHFLLRPRGWAIASDHLQALVACHGAGVRLTVSDGPVLEASLQAFLEHGAPFTHAGFEAQVVLPERWWTEPGRAAQLSLFGVAS